MSEPRKIAESAGRFSTVKAFLDEETKEVTFESVSYDGREATLGPVKREELEMFIHCITDVLQMEGRYLFLEP